VKGCTVRRFFVDPELASQLAVADAQAAPSRECDEFAANLRSWCRRELVSRPGYLLMTGLEHLSEPEARRFVRRIAHLLGEPIQHDGTGAIIRDVLDRGASLESERTVRYSDTRYGGNPHTDGCHRPGPVPDIFTLYCVRQAARGGCLLLVHLHDVLRELRKTPSVIETLCLPVHFDTRGTREPLTVQRPILEAIAGGVRFNYVRAYIDSAYETLDLPPLSASQLAAFDVLDRLLNRPEVQSRCRLAPGEMIVVNNRSVIHARTTFSPEAQGHGRLFLRVWIDASAKVFDAHGPGGAPEELVNSLR
jgi:alpha-ketoglutarate-dependent taurine dioxygenase